MSRCYIVSIPARYLEFLELDMTGKPAGVVNGIRSGRCRVARLPPTATEHSMIALRYSTPSSLNTPCEVTAKLSLQVNGSAAQGFRPERVPTASQETERQDEQLKDSAVNGTIGGDDEARIAAEHEHTLALLDAVKLYPGAIWWSFFVSMGVIMTAFDPQLLGNLYATPAFQRDFGYPYRGRYIISAPWQTGLSMGNPVGQAVGAFCAAYPMERFGRKRTFGVCVVLTAGLIFIQFFARSLTVLLVGELLGGLVLGSYAVIAPAYASEVCPVALRKAG